MPILSRLMVLFLTVLSCVSAARAEEFDSGGVKIHYRVEGQGEPVILVHGLYSTSRINWDMPGTAALLARHYRVIEFDNRGHGQSGKPTDNNAYGAEMCEDVVRLMDHLGIQKAHVVGYSLGGFIVMKLLTMHPERVETAVMCGASWLREGSPLDRFWTFVPNRGRGPVPSACLQGIAQLGTTAEQVKAIHVPVSLIVGDRDPCRRMYMEPLRRIRPDWPEYVVAGAGHFNCIVKPEFKSDLEKVLAQ